MSALGVDRRIEIAMMPLQAAIQMNREGRMADRELALLNLSTVCEVGRIAEESREAEATRGADDLSGA